MTKLEAIFDNKTFIIEEDENVGFYLYVYQENECLFDHLQDELEIAIEQAEEDYGVDPNSWKQINKKKKS